MQSKSVQSVSRIRSAIEELERRQLLTATLTTLAELNGSSGTNPEAGVILGADGNFYGTAQGGGSAGRGSVFRVTPSGTASAFASFGSPNGELPEGRLLADSVGNFYGTTSDGTLFKVTPSGSLSTIAVFNHQIGDDPEAGLIADSAGNLYGTARAGGLNDPNNTVEGYGSIFKYTPAGSLSRFASFGPANEFPVGDLIQDSSGNFYGTSEGRGNNVGTIFKVSPSGTVSTLVTFNNSNGATPVTGLVADSAGNMYGTTTAGGDYGYGTIFKVTPSGTLTKLFSFDAYDGSNPQGTLLLDSAGNLYGTTTEGGADVSFDADNPRPGSGTVFKLATDGTLTTLANFPTNSLPTPIGPLIADASGNLYGTTSFGGSLHEGTVFKVTGSGFVTGTITVTPPAAQTGTQNANHAFALGSFTAAGTTGPYKANVDWGDGTTHQVISIAAAGSLGNLNHLYTTAGAKTVTVVVTDAKGATSNAATFTATVKGVDPATQVLEAEDGGLSGDAVVTNGNPGYTGTGAVGMGQPGAMITVGTNRYSAGGYITIRYANQTNKNTPVSITLNGTVIATPSFVPTGGASNWRTVEFGANLIAGGNTINLTNTTNTGGGLAIDNVTITTTKPPALSLVAPAAQSSTAGANHAFALGSFTSLNATGPFKADVNWGDGSADQIITVTAQGTLPNLNHLYATAGTRAVSVTMTDAARNTSNTVTFNATAAGVDPATLTLEAENVSLTGGTTVGTASTGYTGSGYAQFANKNSGVTFTTTRYAAGAAKLTFRYANGSTSARPLAISVNGTLISTPNFGPTGGYSTWTTVTINVNLLAGSNTIALVAAGTTNDLRLDNLTIMKS